MGSSTGLKSTDLVTANKPKKCGEVLLVESNAEDADLAVRALMKINAAVHVEVVNDGADALDFLFNTGEHAYRHPAQTPDLILLNLKVPAINGLEVLRILKAYARTKTIPVVILTRSGEDQGVIQAYQLGANSCIHKSSGGDQLSNAIEHVGFYWLMLNHPEPARKNATAAAVNLPAYTGV